jgi:hypothetical protein
MREAREHGKFLSDVVDVTWQHLKQAHAPINSLSALLRSIADFSHQVRTRQAAAQQAERQQREAIEVHNALASCAGDVFFDVSGERRIVIGEDAASMTVHDWREATPRVAAGHWQAAFVNALRVGNVRRANRADEETFIARRHPVFVRCRLSPCRACAGQVRSQRALQRLVVDVLVEGPYDCLKRSMRAYLLRGRPVTWLDNFDRAIRTGHAGRRRVPDQAGRFRAWSSHWERRRAREIPAQRVGHPVVTGLRDEAIAYVRATGRDVDEKELKRFANASTHLLRHSYAKGLAEALKHGLDAPVGADNMGHAVGQHDRQT